MTSQISTRKLLHLEIKQTYWMFALSALGQFMAGPVLFMMSIQSSYTTQDITASRYAGFISGSYLLCQIFLQILCICFTIYSNRYLFSKRMVDLYHAMPVTRGKLFTVKYLHGLFVWLVPFLAFSLTVPLLAFIRLNTDLTWTYIGWILTAYGSTLVLSLFCFFIFYHLYLVALYLSGNVLNMFTNVAIMGFSVISFFALTYACAEQYLDTFCIEIPQWTQQLLIALSPFTSPFFIYAYIESNNTLGSLFTNYPFLIILCFLLSLCMFFLAKWLYKKRASELAERGTLNKPYTEVAKYVISLIAAVAMSIFFGELVYGSSGLFWSIFGALFGGILSYGALNSIFHASIKAFFKQKVPMALITVCGVLFITAFHLDWFGYDTYLPKKNQIAGVAIYMHGLSDNSSDVLILNPNSADSLSGSSTFRMNSGNAQRVVQENLLTDKDICYNFLRRAVSHEGKNIPMESAEAYYDVKTEPMDHISNTKNTFRSFYAKVELENGRTYYRKYRLRYSDYEMLRDFVETDEYRLTNYKLSSGLMGYPSKLNAYLQTNHTSLDISKEHIPGLMDAFYADFAEHYTLDELTSHLFSVSMEMQFYSAEGHNYYYNVTVPANYTRTMDYLAKLYPALVPCVVEKEDIIAVSPYSSRNLYSQYGGYARYFGIEGAEISQKLSDILKELNKEYVDYEVSDSVRVEQVIVAESTYGYTSEGEITDRDFIETLLPYLYFGDYSDMFDFRDYIFFGNLRTSTNTISCYVKANTLPMEIIDYLEESITLKAK